MTVPVHPGDVLLGKYRVEHVLGKGGMGVVVAATHLDLAELFAIKFLLPEALANDNAVERFLHEARAAVRLKGEHVAKVHDVGRLESGVPYMVMEHLEGMDLEQVVRSRGPLPVEEAVLYVLQACDAVAEAHARGIVHRDLKPSNLFLTRRHDGSPCIKVLDFGISKQQAQVSLELTTTGVVLGSPLYMSPERMTRTREVDLRSDIWSMGVVLYKLLTGRVPFEAEVLTELVGHVLQDQPAKPGRLRPDLPPSLDPIVLRCLEKRPEHRFATMDALASALRSLPLGPAVAMGRTAIGSMPQLSEPMLGAPAPAGGNTTTSFERTRVVTPARLKAHLKAGALGSLAALIGVGAWVGLRVLRTETALPAPTATTTLAAVETYAPDPPTTAAPDPKSALEAAAPGVLRAPAEPTGQVAAEQPPTATSAKAAAAAPRSSAATGKPASRPLPAKGAKPASPSPAQPRHESMF